ncbi:MAG: hypothetical protein GY913_23180 [Proteobacteria bacterium]|nr:hypothetical protein [Pseudomonadota bacterium]MCP4919815.1 hypothetical protein [Pseudomonadota bacterium]
MMLLLALACSTGSEQASVEVEAKPLTGAGCAVCGMFVAEQPSPRAQLVYGDGTHVHFCGVGDLRASLQAPSPQGEVLQAWVEALPADFDVAADSTAALPWVPAESAWFAFGMERPLVMGLPALSFGDEAVARQVATRLGLELHAWESVQASPFDQIPPVPSTP